MRTRTVAPTLLSLLFTLLHTCSSSPLPVPDPAAVAEPVPAPQVNAICSSSLGQTSCGEICCASDQVCLYLGQCGAAAAAQWNYYTTTYTVTGLVTSVRTSTYSSFVGAATPNPSVSNAPTTTWSLTYYTSNAVNPSSSAGFAYTYTTGSFTPPTRPTESFNGGVIGGDISGSKIMVPSATGTNTYVVPVATGDLGYAGVVGAGGSHHSLSGAQIGGIVGGILGALFLIALILFCCCLRKGFKGFFGWMNSFGRRKEEHETVIVDHGHGSSGHGAGYAGAAAAGAGAGLLASLWGRRKTTTTTTTTTHHHGATHSGSHGVAYGGHASSGHASSGHGASGIVAGGHNGQSGGASHSRGGLAAMMGAAAAGLTSIFITRRTQQHMSEKYTSSDESYSSDYVSETSETGSSSSSSSSSSSGSSSSSSSSSSDGHIHGHGRH